MSGGGKYGTIMSYVIDQWVHCAGGCGATVKLRFDAEEEIQRVARVAGVSTEYAAFRVSRSSYLQRRACGAKGMQAFCAKCGTFDGATGPEEKGAKS